MRAAFAQVRKRPPVPLAAPREIVIACPEMQSQVNFARIVRTASCFGITQLLAAGRGRLDVSISRGAEEHVNVRRCRSLLHPLRKLRADGYSIVGLEQTEASRSLFAFAFPRRCVLLVGHERSGVADELLELCDATAEIPSFGFPGSHNASTAAMLGMYEYCRQHSGALDASALCDAASETPFSAT